MSDPARLIHGPEHSLEAALLRSARRESPPARAHERMLSTLGVSATAATAVTVTAKAAAALAVANAKPAALGMTGAFVAKWAVIGSVGALVSVGVVRQVPVFMGHGSHVPPAPSSITRASSNGPAKPNGAQSNLAVSDTAQARADSVTPGLPSYDARSAPSPVKPSSIARSAEASSLADEVAALDQARVAAAEHNPARTMALLDAYQRQFPNGSLGPEAQLLRIEALVQSGRRAQALPLARRLLTAAPDGPLSERIHALLPEVD